MKRIIFICCFLLLALPASAFATGSTKNSYKGPGGETVTPGQGGGAVGVSFNDLKDRGRDLEWDRDWSKVLIDGNHGWCDRSDRAELTIAQLSQSTVGKLFTTATERPGERAGEKIGWAWQKAPGEAELGFDSVAAWAKTGTCNSPMAVWGYGGSRSIEAAAYAYPSGKIIEDKDKPSRNTSQYKAWAYLKQAAEQIGYENRCEVPGNVSRSPNQKCLENPKFAIGDGSWSEQIPLHPDSGRYLEPGAANTAIVRIWRECAHKYPDAASAGGTVLKASSPARYAEGTKCLDAPILERVPPLAKPNESSKTCPGRYTPFHSTWVLGARGPDKYCSTSHNYFNSSFFPGGTKGEGRRGGNYTSQYGATDPAKEPGRNSSFDALSKDYDTTAGVLFASCDDAKDSARNSKYNKSYCRDPREGKNPIGLSKKANVPADKSFESSCNDGAARGGNWGWYDYAGQLAEGMHNSDQISAAAARKSLAILKKHSAAGPNGVAENFATLFTYWNPPFLAKLDTPGLFPPSPNAAQAAAINELKERINGGSSYPKGRWLPKNAIEGAASESAAWKRKGYKNLSCQFFNDWTSLDWTLGRKKGNSVTVNMQPIPNRLYLIQVVMLDQRENIVSQSLQFSGGYATGQMPTALPGCISIDDKPCGTPDPRDYCYKYHDPALEGAALDASKIWFDKGDPLPAACKGDRSIVEVGPAPKNSDFQSSQPLSQISGQSWQLPASPPNETMGSLKAAPSGAAGDLPDGTASPTEDNPSYKLNLTMPKLWQPRALAATVFNPDNFKKNLSYSQSHRIEVESDKGTNIKSTDRFKLTSGLIRKPSEGGPSEGGIGWVEGSNWFQAKLPLISDGSVFRNSWAVASANPTRAPEELSEQQLLERDQAFAARLGYTPDAVQLRALADSATRSKADETRFGSLLGEGRFLFKTQTSRNCTNPVNSAAAPDCSPRQDNITHGWRKLTSDRCEGPGDPLISINNDAPRVCDPEAEVGAGWKVKDAYILPELADNNTGKFSNMVELASVFKTDKKAAAHLQLERIPNESIAKIAVWKLSDYLARDAPSEDNLPIDLPRASYEATGQQNSINFCKPIAPYYVDETRTYREGNVWSRVGTVDHHKKSDYAEGMISAPGQPKTALQRLATASNDGEDVRWDAYNANGSAPYGRDARASGSWDVTASQRGNVTLNGWSSTSEESAPSWATISDFFGNRAAGSGYVSSPLGQHPLESLRAYGDNPANWTWAITAGTLRAWEAEQPPKSLADHKRDLLGGAWTRNPWNTSEGNLWTDLGAGKDWWFGPEDDGRQDIYQKVGPETRSYTERVLAADVGKCEDDPTVYPNAKFVNADGALSTGLSDSLEQSPEGEGWVVVFSVVGPLAESSWGIKGDYYESADAQWVNSFDLQQTAARTAIYRYRPTG